MIAKKARLSDSRFSKPDFGLADIRSGKKSRQEKLERKNGVANKLAGEFSLVDWPVTNKSSQIVNWHRPLPMRTAPVATAPVLL